MSRRGVTKSVVEEAALAWIESIGWSVRNGAKIAPSEPSAERRLRQVVLAQRLRDARHGGDAGDGASAWSGIAAEHIDNKPHRGVLAHRFRDAKIR